MYMLIIGGILRFFRKLFGGGGDEASGQSVPQPITFQERLAQVRDQASSLAEQEAQRQAERKADLSAEGPLETANVNIGTKGQSLPVSFFREEGGLVVTHDTGDPSFGQQKFLVLLDCLYGVAAGGTLRIDLHVPLPIWIDGQPKAIRTIFADIPNPAADARWGVLADRNYLRQPTCPYCFRAALDLEPQGTDVPLPIDDQGPKVVAKCAACHHEFRYDYTGGKFDQTDED